MPFFVPECLWAELLLPRVLSALLSFTALFSISTSQVKKIWICHRLKLIHFIQRYARTTTQHTSCSRPFSNCLLPSPSIPQSRVCVVFANGTHCARHLPQVWFSTIILRRWWVLCIYLLTACCLSLVHLKNCKFVSIFFPYTMLFCLWWFIGCTPLNNTE